MLGGQLAATCSICLFGLLYWKSTGFHHWNWGYLRLSLKFWNMVWQWLIWMVHLGPKKHFWGWFLSGAIIKKIASGNQAFSMEIHHLYSSWYIFPQQDLHQNRGFPTKPRVVTWVWGQGTPTSKWTVPACPSRGRQAKAKWQTQTELCWLYKLYINLFPLSTYLSKSLHSVSNISNV